MTSGHRPIHATRTRSKFRLICQFRLTKAVSDRIDQLAHDRGISRSDLIEHMVTFDYALVFKLFLSGAKHAEVVVATGLEPELVRELFAEYRAGYNPCERVPAVAVAHARERAAREKRIAAEALAGVRTVEALARERRHVRSAWVELDKSHTRKHLGELAENTRILTRGRAAGGKP
jgi:hypothetical protein